jgi:hypothetical protein
VRRGAHPLPPLRRPDEQGELPRPVGRGGDVRGQDLVDDRPHPARCPGEAEGDRDPADHRAPRPRPGQQGRRDTGCRDGRAGACRHRRARRGRQPLPEGDATSCAERTCWRVTPCLARCGAPGLPRGDRLTPVVLPSPPRTSSTVAAARASALLTDGWSRLRRRRRCRRVPRAGAAGTGGTTGGPAGKRSAQPLRAGRRARTAARPQGGPPLAGAVPQRALQLLPGRAARLGRRRLRPRAAAGQLDIGRPRRRRVHRERPLGRVWARRRLARQDREEPTRE